MQESIFPINNLTEQQLDYNKEGRLCMVALAHWTQVVVGGHHQTCVADHPGCQFRRKNFGLKTSTNISMRSKFDSVTCLYKKFPHCNFDLKTSRKNGLNSSWFSCLFFPLELTPRTSDLQNAARRGWGYCSSSPFPTGGEGGHV